MYSSEPSRPNVPVNLLVGLEVLKAGFGWSDAERRRRSQIYLQDGRNLRASVEATVCQVKHPFPGRKLPVRGQFRVTCMLIGSAIVSSIRRIQRYNLKETQKNDQMATQGQQEGNRPSSFCVFIIYLHSLITPFTCKMRVFCR